MTDPDEYMEQRAVRLEREREEMILGHMGELMLALEEWRPAEFIEWLWEKHKVDLENLETMAEVDTLRFMAEHLRECARQIDTEP